MRSTLDVHKAHHRPGPPLYLDEAALDHVRGAQFAPQVPRESEEGQQLRQVSLQAPHQKLSLPSMTSPFNSGSENIPSGADSSAASPASKPSSWE